MVGCGLNAKRWSTSRFVQSDNTTLAKKNINNNNSKCGSSLEITWNREKGAPAQKKKKNCIISFFILNLVAFSPIVIWAKNRKKRVKKSTHNNACKSVSGPFFAVLCPFVQRDRFFQQQQHTKREKKYPKQWTTLTSHTYFRATNVRFLFFRLLYFVRFTKYIRKVFDHTKIYMIFSLFNIDKLL